MSKIPFRIYRLDKNQGSNIGFSRLSPSKYLVDISENNIINGGRGQVEDLLEFTPSNLPGYSGPSFVSRRTIVFGPTSWGKYIKFNNKTYYILGTEAKTNKDDNAAIPKVFEFYLDPQHIIPEYRKLQTEIRTRGGWEIQHWGEALTEVRVQGKSGGMHQLSPGRPLGREDDVTQSLAWQRLNQLKALYDSDHNVKNQADTVLLGMNYFDKYFIGYFTDFSGPEASSENPYIVDFSFTFKVQQELSTTSAISNNIMI
ncbi:MAG: hypothetical protein M0R17_02310 [Candidatus Omnitrophica bacterium]|jgi:hypothetical protein|nr:hypothetical protein [Candidatus Omnitrophota bacterium]